MLHQGASSVTGDTSPAHNDAIEVVINKLQEIVQEPARKAALASASPTMNNQSKTIRIEKASSSKETPRASSGQEMVVQIPGIKGQVSAQNTDHLIDALHKINSALGKVNAKTPISEAKPTKNANTGENVYQCHQCEYWSHNKYYWKQHVDLVHNAERVYKCPFCDYAGKRSHSLKEHLVVHSNYRPYECTLCNASFRKKGHLTNHIRMHSQRKIDEENKCNTCKVMVPDSAALFAHLRSLHKSQKDIYLCEFCQFATQYKSNIVMHMQAHGNPQTLCCNICGHQTCHYNILLEHFISTHPKSTVAFTTIQSEMAQPVILMKCTECGFTAGSNDALRQHMYTHLDNGSVAQSKTQPETSTASQPAAQYAYKCSQCSYTSSEACTFITHMVTHKNDGGKPADKPTKSTAPHIPGAKPITHTDESGVDQGWYQCTICGYLGQQRTIKAHIWKHSGHKDVSYPMFQNGPLSIYDETPVGFKKLKNEMVITTQMVKIKDAKPEDKDSAKDQKGAKVVRKNALLKDASTKTGEVVLTSQNSKAERKLTFKARNENINDKEMEMEEQSDAQQVLEEVQGDSCTLVEIGELDEHITAVELSSKPVVNQAGISGQVIPCADNNVIVQGKSTKRKADEVRESKPKVPKIETVVENFPGPNSDDVGLEIEISCEEPNEEKVVDESAEIMKALHSTRRSQEEILALLALLQSNQGSNGNQPKEPGICKSLLAVIEQLRERSTSFSADERGEVEEELSSEESIQERPAEDVHLLHKNIEMIDGGYRCKLCHYFSSSPPNIKTHMRQHKSKAPHECSLCEFEAVSSAELQEHMLCHCKMRTFQCKQCLATFHYKGQLKAHMKEHTDLAEQQKQQEIVARRCENCCEVFPTSDKLQKHKEVCHKFEICTRCNGRIGQKRQHKCKKIYKCETCSVVCPNLTSMRQHVKEHALPENLQCELCEFLATSVRSLKSHMKRHRNDQRFVEQPLEQYKCNLCGYVCHHLPSLKSHMWRHANDRNYSYQQTNDVINHALQNSVSTGGSSSVITFRCCQCGFESVDKSELNHHMASHNDIIQRTLEVNKGRILGKMVERLHAGAEVNAGKENANFQQYTVYEKHTKSN